jgi:hypothetical protein
LRTREPSDRVDEKEDPRAPIAKVFPVSSGNVCGAQALERGSVARGHDDDTLLPPLGAQRPLEELAHLAPSLADERHDDNVGVGSTSDRAKERALSDARSREQSQPLALPECKQAIEDSDASGHGARHRSSFERTRRVTVDRNELAADRRSAVERATQPVHYASQELVAGSYEERPAGRFDLVVRSDASERTEGHRDGLPALETHNLARERTAPSLDQRQVADADPRHHEAEAEPRDRGHTTARTQSRDVSELGRKLGLGVGVERHRLLSGGRSLSFFVGL